MNKAFKCRIYPTKGQIRQIETTFWACRKVWNHSLDIKKQAYEYDKTSFSYYDLSAMLPYLKRVCPDLAQADSQALKYSLRDLDAAYKNFFRRVKNGEKPGFPKFKSAWDGNQSYKTLGSVKVIDEHHIQLPKLGKVKCRGLAEVQGRIVNATVRRVPSGKYFVSLCCDGVPEPEAPEPKVDMLGIDMGIGDDLMVRSDGVKIANPRALRKSEKKLKREQRRLSRKVKGSANFEKQRVKVARTYERIANQRRDAIHNATTQAVRDASAIAVEDLNVKGMQGNGKLSKSVSDAAMSEAVRQLEYKCGWYGRDFAKVGRYFPSTQVCGCCGAIAGPKGFSGLRERTWVCPECGAEHDRDVNAAKNIAVEGARIIAER
jgi:putative transposase